MECQKVKSKADCDKNWAKSIKYANCIQVFSKPLKILPPRGLRGNKKRTKCKYANCIHVFSKPIKILPFRGLRGNKKEQNVNVFIN